MKTKPIDKDKLIMEISELIGKLSGRQLTINGDKGQVIIGAVSLISFLRKIQYALLQQNNDLLNYKWRTKNF